MARGDGKRGGHAGDAGPMPDGEGFLDRWSKRKLEARKEDPVRAPEEPDDGTPPPEAAAPPLGDDDMPAIDSLTPESDYTGFLSEGVSEKLRKLALRRLFHLADFNVRDGLDDYDEDFTRFEPLGDIVTADTRHQRELRQASDAPPGVEVAEVAADTPESVPAEHAPESAAPRAAAPQEAPSGDAIRTPVAGGLAPGDAGAGAPGSREDVT